jgi:Sulfotransferase domain
MVEDCTMSEEDVEFAFDDDTPYLYDEKLHPLPMRSRCGLLVCFVAALTAFTAPTVYRLCGRQEGKLYRASEGSVVTVFQGNGKGIADSFVYPSHLPEVAWMLSFGGSGTSYTVLNTEQMSGATTASNYGADYDPCLSVHPNYPSGPFLRSPRKPFPTHFILTKTHCGAFCMDCAPGDYVYDSVDDFETSCVTGKKRLPTGIVESVSYDSSIPAKAVHLIRNPIDNLVSRLHLAIKHKKERVTGDESELEHVHSELDRTYPNNRTGLDAWCRYLDEKYVVSDVQNKILQKYVSIPCHAEWFRYIQWHNLAVQVTAKLHLPVHYVWYENYTMNFDDTVTALFDFLELDATGDPYEWQAGKSYSNFFLPATARKAALMMQDLASPEAWSLIRHYLVPFLLVPKDSSALDDGTDLVPDKYDVDTDEQKLSDENDDDVIDSRDPFSAELTTALEPDDKNPQVVWLLSFPNSVRRRPRSCRKWYQGALLCLIQSLVSLFVAGHIIHGEKCRRTVQRDDWFQLRERLDVCLSDPP